MLHQSGHLDQAEAIYDRVIEGHPKNADAWIYRGIAYFDRHDFSASIDAYKRALAIRRTDPVAWNNLGNALRMVGEIDEADACFETALNQRPGYLSALKNRGTLWVWAGEIERGLRWYAEGLRSNPDDAELHRNVGVIELLRGNFDRGWREYRWRWRMPGLTRPNTAAPPWRGEDLCGRSILLFAEQGLGDTIQFVRAVGLLADRGARVHLLVPPKLLALLTSVEGAEALHLDADLAPATDYQASLIEVFDRLHETEGRMLHAATADGYLRVSDELVAHWGKRLAVRFGDQRRIGINWQGNPTHHADIYRSVPLRAFAPLAAEGHRLISLQFGFGTEQRLSCPFADQIDCLPEDVDDAGQAFTDTAAILPHLDEIVTTDTALAHLAGAVGVRVTVLLGKVPDWRWGLSGDRTPWYPTMRLIRQRDLGDWSSVMADVIGST